MLTPKKGQGMEARKVEERKSTQENNKTIHQARKGFPLLAGFVSFCANTFLPHLELPCDDLLCKRRKKLVLLATHASWPDCRIENMKWGLFVVLCAVAHVGLGWLWINNSTVASTLHTTSVPAAPIIITRTDSEPRRDSKCVLQLLPSSTSSFTSKR